MSLEFRRRYRLVAVSTAGICLAATTPPQVDDASHIEEIVVFSMRKPGTRANSSSLSVTTL